MSTKRSADELAKRLKELRPVPEDSDGALALCRDGESLEATLARIKAAAVAVFGPDVQCRYRQVVVSIETAKKKTT